MNYLKSQKKLNFLIKLKWFFYIILLAAVLVNIVLFYNSLLISASESFEIIYKTVICIIFPYMIIAELVCTVPVHKILPHPIKQMYEKIFSADAKTVLALIMGNICGYPVGAKILISQHQAGIISKTVLENMLPYVTNSSAGFVIGTIGVAICKNKYIGIIIYIIQIMSVIICAAISKKQIVYKSDAQHRFKAKSIGKIIADSTQNTVLICGTILSFNLFITMVVNLTAMLKLSYKTQNIIQLITASVAEITNGVICASRFADGALLCILLTMINCFSGLSVAMQIKMIAPDGMFSLKPYFVKKTFQSIIGGMLMVLVYVVFT